MKDSRHKTSVQIFDGPGRPFRLEKWRLPETLGNGQVLTEVELATICGSDLHTISGRRKEPTPAILGHEAVGRIVQVGPGRENLSPGDRITWSIADSCGSCPPCSEYQLPQKCHSLFKYGHATITDGTGLNGCYASHILLRQGTHIVKVPECLPTNIVAPANCALATMVYAVSRLPESCNAVVVQGAGLLGLYGCALLRERGVQHVFCVDIQEQRLAQVHLFGGTAIDGRPEFYADAREKITTVAPAGVDALLEAAGVAALVPEGVQLLRVGGFYGFVGMVHPETALELTGEQVVRKCLTIFGVHNYGPWHLEQAVQFLEQTFHKYPYQSLVSPPFSLIDLEGAIQAAEAQEWCRVSVQANT